MSKSHGTGEQDEMGEFEVEENRDDNGEAGAGYGAGDEGDAGVEGPGDQSGVGELAEEDENWAD